MRALSPEGERVLHDISARHGFSTNAVQTMLEAVLNGQGQMAQFSHPEFGGSGQWMRGGMTMIGDMFNNGLKGRVDSLCAELCGLVGGPADGLWQGSFQSQTQGGVAHQSQSAGGWGPAEGSQSGLFAPAPPDWWGPDLRWPNSTGAQNGLRYAYFAQARRLAVEVNGQVTVYDTLDHQIGGVSQQQSGSGTVSFSSQYGPVDLASLPVLTVNGQAPLPASPAPTAPATSPGAPAWAAPAPTPVSTPTPTTAGEPDIFATIERLAELHRKGVLSPDEFQTKKAELLARL